MEPYRYYEREIHYYETDKMGVVHHSNYARILEECRIDMMRYYGIPMVEIEARGFMIPVLELTEKFVESIRFGETIRVLAEIVKVSGYKFCIQYLIYDQEMKTIKHRATTTHCFLDSSFKPVSMKIVAPELFAKLASLVTPGAIGKEERMSLEKKEAEDD